MAAQKTARASPELRKGSTQPALPSVLHHHPGHKRLFSKLVVALAVNDQFRRFCRRSQQRQRPRVGVERYIGHHGPACLKRTQT